MDLTEARLRKLAGIPLLEDDKATRSKVAVAFDKEMEFDKGRDGWQWQGRLKRPEVLRVVAKVTGDNKPEAIKNTASGDLYRFKGADILFPKSSKKFVKIKLFNR
jgi:hypothetical protein